MQEKLQSEETIAHDWTIGGLLKTWRVPLENEVP